MKACHVYGHRLNLLFDKEREGGFVSRVMTAFELRTRVEAQMVIIAHSWNQLEAGL